MGAVIVDIMGIMAIMGIIIITITGKPHKKYIYENEVIINRCCICADLELMRLITAMHKQVSNNLPHLPGPVSWRSY